MNAGVKSVPEGTGERDAGPVSSERLLKIMAESMAEGKSLMADFSGEGVRPNLLVAALHGIEPAQAELCARALTQAREEVQALRTEKKVRGEFSGQRQVFREVVTWDPVALAGIRSRLEAALRQSVGEARMDLFQTALRESWPQHESEFCEWVFEIQPDGKVKETSSMGVENAGVRHNENTKTTEWEEVPARLLELQTATK